MRVKEESEKAGLNLSIQKTKRMAPSPITSWQLDGEKVETVNRKKKKKKTEKMETINKTLFWGAPISLQMVTTAMKLKDTYSLEAKP